MGWNQKRVLVTGADGFIGSHLTEALVREGATVTALAQYNSFDSHGWLDDLPRDIRELVEAERGDIRDAHQMRSLCRGKDVVFHLAALISIPHSYVAPASYIDTNVTGTLNVLQAALDGGVGRMIQTSTSEVYGTAQTTPIAETHPLQGQSPYSASKIAADMMTEAFARSFGLPVITLRPFNTFGPRQSERAIIASVVRQALDPDLRRIRVGNLLPRRAFSFVSDTVAAFLAVSDMKADTDIHGRVFNAGSDRMVSIADLIEIVCTAAECKKPIEQEDTRFRPDASEVMALVANSSALNAVSGWAPKVPLEEGIARTIEWWIGRNDQIRPNHSYIV